MEKKFLWSYLKRYQLIMPFLFFFSLILGMISGIITSFIGPALQIFTAQDLDQMFSLELLFGDRIGAFFEIFFHETQFPAKDFIRVIPWCLFFLALLKAFFHFLNVFSWEKIAASIIYNIRQTIISQYLKGDPAIRDQIPEEELASLISTDTKLVGEYIVHFYGGLPREGIQVGILLTTQYFLSSKLFFMIIVAFLPMAFIMSKLGKKLKRQSKIALDQSSQLTEWLQQRLLGIETIKHYGTEPIEIRAMEEKTQELSQAFLKSFRIKAISSPLSHFFLILGLAGILFSTFSDIQNGSLTGSVVISFFASVALLSQSVAICAKYYNANREAWGALTRLARFNPPAATTLFQYLDLPKEDSSWMKWKHGKLAYCEKTVLDSFSLSLKKGHIYVLSGASGSGKSTFVKHVCSLLPLSSGQRWQQKNLKLGYMPQDFELFSGSIAQHIAYPDSDMEEQKILEALELAGLKDTVKDLPQGIYQLVGPGGQTLSGGQTQRILLGRLFYHDYDVIVIDEGTSALDPATEEIFYTSLKKLFDRKPDLTVLLIAHRSKAFDIGTRVWLCEKGRIVEI